MCDDCVECLWYRSVIEGEGGGEGGGVCEKMSTQLIHHLDHMLISRQDKGATGR